MGGGGGGGGEDSSRARLRASAACRFSSIAALSTPVKVLGTEVSTFAGGSGSGSLHALQQKTANLLRLLST